MKEQLEETTTLATAATRAFSSSSSKEQLEETTTRAADSISRCRSRMEQLEETTTWSELKGPLFSMVLEQLEETTTPQQERSDTRCSREVPGATRGNYNLDQNRVADPFRPQRRRSNSRKLQRSGGERTTARVFPRSNSRKLQHIVKPKPRLRVEKKEQLEETTTLSERNVVYA